MSQVINTNVLSLNAQRNLGNSQGALAQSLERLSSGLRINSAKDDAAGLAISERFTSQIRGLNQAARNANDGISFAQSAEGALGTIGDAMQRIRELAVQAANDTNSSSDRQALNNEVQQLVEEINRVANSTEFNGENILNGELEDLVFQVGANQNQTISVDGVDARGSQLGTASLGGESLLLSDLPDDDGDLDLTDIVINERTINLGSAEDLDDVVTAINAATDDTGVSAARAEEVVQTIGAIDSTGGATVTINEVDITIADGATDEEILDAINAESAQTNVTASFDGDGELVLTGSGDDIAVDVDGGTDFSFGDLGNDGEETYLRAIELSASPADGIDVGGTNAEVLALDGDVNVNTLDGVSVASREDATETIGTIDAALQQISGLRSELGAVQIRFENTIANLEISSENLSAARSRIMDADFASETAELTRAQVLQQAGTSVLSQANAVPQNVLALLQ
ncbi:MULTISPECIES: flagellin [unclassified Thioalkalivibrio]|uniref:flagellin N-terminal helical domain-containing protein n=1 Tax=unclassified Thioalkalivibrio TaxID=2621013 RepID=UPI00036F05E0|nr:MULTISPECIES: flagellin [unclassified Thioalkalivibrio]